MTPFYFWLSRGDLVCFRHGTQHQRRSPSGWLAGGADWKCLLSEASGEFQEPGIHRQSGLHLRAGVRAVRPGPDVGETAELHFPVSAGDQETDEEVRPPRPSLRLHLTEFVPQVLLRRQRSVCLTSTCSDLICSVQTTAIFQNLTRTTAVILN